MTAPVLVIDGVDGSGKTSIARGLALHLGGRYVKAFEGETGRRIRLLNESGERAASEKLARQAAHETVIRNADARLLVFDRHWLSILAYISEEFAPNWQPHPPTVLVSASPDTIRARLRARGTLRQELDGVGRYMHRFDVLAARFHLPRLDTTNISVDDAVRIISVSGWV